MNRIVSTLALALCTLAASSTFAATKTYQATLSGLNEATPVITTGSGLVTFVFDDVANTLAVNAQFQNLLTPTTDAHIHCCTAQPFIGAVSVAVPMGGAFPLHVTSGSYNHVFDLGLTTSYTPGFLNTKGGGSAIGARDALLAGIDANTAYFNIHTEGNPGGEIRGFLTAVPTSPVPEPQTYAMLGVGLAGVVLAARRKNLRG